MPLSLASIGRKLTIIRIRGKDRDINHLKSLGFIEGETVTILSEMGGDLIVKVKETRIAISRIMANKIIIK